MNRVHVRYEQGSGYGMNRVHVKYEKGSGYGMNGFTLDMRRVQVMG